MRAHRTLKLSRPHPDVQFLFKRPRGLRPPPDGRTSPYEGYLPWVKTQVDHGTDEFHAAQSHQRPTHIARRRTLDAPCSARTVPAVTSPGRRQSNLDQFSGAPRARLGPFNTMLTPPPSPQRSGNSVNAHVYASPRPSDPVPAYPR